MNKITLLSLIILIFLSSCSQYVVTGTRSGCGAWMPKHYSGKAPKQKSFARMPVIN